MNAHELRKRILAASDGVYGVQWDVTNSATGMTRVGNMALHVSTSLPVHRKMRRCLLLDNGTVNYYLKDTDSHLREDNTAATLDGSHGQVMVELPQHWRRFDTEANIRRVLVSTSPFPGSHRVARSYVSAFEASVFRPSNILSSVINTTADYRGGNNNAAWDLEDRSLLGMPSSLISRINYTDYARNRGAANWNAYLYETHKAIFWLYAIEFANKNSQLAWSNTPDVDGYKQGGLGAGVTTVDSTNWNTYNNYYPIVPCGAGLMSNYSGVTDFTVPTLGLVSIPTYRGIEHPFGHVWKWTEGVNIRIPATGDTELYKANSLDFSSVNYDGYTLSGILPRTSNWIQEMLFGVYGDILPSTVGASSTTYWSDYFYTSIPGSGESLRGLLLGGSANFGTRAGLGCSNTYYAPSYTGTSVGSRLCFVTEGA